MQDKRKRLLQWHPAFFAGIQIELSEEAEYLSFESEHMLSSRPMQLDVLIIKKDRDRQIKKNIGQIFRTYNIVEYKSPEDSLNIDDFYKAYGYTCFYKADNGRVNSIHAKELTVSLVCSRYPRELLRYLTQEQHLTIVQKEAGIYYVLNGLFPVQIIVTKQLSEENNLWLKSLTNDLESDLTAEQLLYSYEKHQTEGLYQSVMEIVIRANEERFMVSDMCEALEEILDARAEKKAVILAEKLAVKLAEEKVVKLTEEKIAALAATLAEEKATALAEEMAEEQKKLAEAKGMEQGLIIQIQKKIRKGKSVTQIADELEETEETILPLYHRLKEEDTRF